MWCFHFFLFFFCWFATWGWVNRKMTQLRGELTILLSYHFTTNCLAIVNHFYHMCISRITHIFMTLIPLIKLCLLKYLIHYEQDFIRISLCIDLRRHLWDQALRFTMLGDSNRWRRSNKYSDLLTRSIYSTTSQNYLCNWNRIRG